jgi:signal transduction histidine kinase
VAFVTSLAATSAAIEGHPDAGVVIDASSHIEAVSPTGFAWRDNIRPGQLVLRSTSAADADGWILVSQGPLGPIESRERPVVDALRGTLPFALIGLGAGCLAVAFLRLNRLWVLPCACLAFDAASVPLFLANQGATALVLATAAFAPLATLAVRVRRRRLVALAIIAGGTALVMAWAWVFTTGGALDPIEPARRTTALAATGLLIVDRAMTTKPSRLSAFQAFWVVVAIGIVATGLSLVYFAALPAPVIAIAIVLGLLAVPPIRSVVGRRLELALMADLRQQVAADVAEEERGRLARELHDAPLQELAAVIRRLELVPEAQDESQSLRSVADQLRSVAVDLRPPMLEDIGLGAALDFLADQVGSPELPVRAKVDDSTELERRTRPPEPVEFALYRIAREAVTNAVTHSQAHEVIIDGRIARDAVDIAVLDDGIGVGQGDARRASGEGRLGIPSMRRRAQAIGAEFAIEARNPGTRVRVSWRA